MTSRGRHRGWLRIVVALWGALCALSLVNLSLLVVMSLWFPEVRWPFFPLFLALLLEALFQVLSARSYVVGARSGRRLMSVACVLNLLKGTVGPAAFGANLALTVSPEFLEAVVAYLVVLGLGLLAWDACWILLLIFIRREDPAEPTALS